MKFHENCPPRNEELIVPLPSTNVTPKIWNQNNSIHSQCGLECLLFFTFPFASFFSIFFWVWCCLSLSDRLSYLCYTSCAWSGRVFRKVCPLLLPDGLSFCVAYACRHKSTKYNITFLRMQAKFSQWKYHLHACRQRHACRWKLTNKKVTSCMIIMCLAFA